jgi:putative Mg2+ transporter-C (MgtC) family protein
LSLAVAAGLILGANRWLHHKSAGVKTHALVALGAALATLVVIPLDTSLTEGLRLNADAASRVLQGLITGIGFLGAGVIIYDARGKRIQGLTTAASIWVTTLIGAALGMGHLLVGCVAVLFAGVVLVTGSAIEHWLGRHISNASDDSDEEDRP